MLWVQFPGNTHTDKKKCITRMHCKSLWIKVSAKCINVNVNRVQMGCCWPHLFSLYGQQSKPFSKYLLLCFAKEIVSQVWNDMKLWMFIFGWTMLLSLKMYTAHTHTHTLGKLCILGETADTFRLWMNYNQHSLASYNLPTSMMQCIMELPYLLRMWSCF